MESFIQHCLEERAKMMTSYQTRWNAWRNGLISDGWKVVETRQDEIAEIKLAMQSCKSQVVVEVVSSGSCNKSLMSLSQENFGEKLRDIPFQFAAPDKPIAKISCLWCGGSTVYIYPAHNYLTNLAAHEHAHRPYYVPFEDVVNVTYPKPFRTLQQAEEKLAQLLLAYEIKFSSAQEMDLFQSEGFEKYGFNCAVVDDQYLHIIQELRNEISFLKSF